MNNDFEAFYRELYGEAWETLRKSLMDPGRRVCRPVFPDLLGPEVFAELKKHNFDLSETAVRQLFERQPELYYVMDYASQLVAEYLPVEPNGTVWDACAAPGGKSLILWSRIQEGELISTDLSKTRYFKMKSMVEQYFGALPDKFWIKNADAQQWGYRRQNQYDSVLLDAPCSSERHVIQDGQALKQWSLARTRSLAKRQYALLCSAVLSVKIGGYIGYSTCSINVGENDAVIDRYLHKKRNVVVEKLKLPIGLETKHGWMIRPDRDDNWGPIYFACLRKIPVAK